MFLDDGNDVDHLRSVLQCLKKPIVSDDAIDLFECVIEFRL